MQIPILSVLAHILYNCYYYYYYCYYYYQY